MDISNGLQPGRQLLRLFKARQKNQAVNLSHFSILFVDRADLTGNHKSGPFLLPSGLRAQNAVLPETVQTVLCRYQLFLQLLSPGRMSKISGSQKPDSLLSGLEIQLLRRQIAAGSPGIPGMNVQICNIHKIPP